VFGPHEEHKGDQASVISKWTENEKITLFKGSENFYRDMIHVRDVCDIHKRFFDIEESGIWNIGTGQAVSFDNLASSLSAYTGFEIEYVDFPKHLKSQYQCYTKADITKLMTTLGGYDFTCTTNPQYYTSPN
jgi:ADP-L-glycero-D-manno-heptose 6-epimerase